MATQLSIYKTFGCSISNPRSTCTVVRPVSVSMMSIGISYIPDSEVCALVKKYSHKYLHVGSTPLTWLSVQNLEFICLFAIWLLYKKSAYEQPAKVYISGFSVEQPHMGSSLYPIAGCFSCQDQLCTLYYTTYSNNLCASVWIKSRLLWITSLVVVSS